MRLKDLHRFGLGDVGGRQRPARGRRSHYRWDFFREPDGQWRWQKFDADGHLIALSPTSYLDVTDCVRSAEANGLVIDGLGLQ